MKLYLLDGPRAGDKFELLASGTTIGRETDNHISILLEGLSRHHAIFRQKDGDWIVEDKGSTNGVKVNGEKISGPHVMSPGDVIKMGPQSMRFGEAGAASFAPMPDPLVPTPDPLDSTGSIVEREKKAEVKGFVDSFAAEDIASAETKHTFKGLFDKVDFFGGGKKPGAAEPPPGAAPPPKKRLMNLIFYLCLTVVVSVALLVFIIMQEQVAERARRADAKDKKPVRKALVVRYEKFRSEPGNVFRYELLVEDDVAKVMVDDLKHQRHYLKTRKLSPAEVERLRSAVAATKFMELGEQPPGESVDGVEERRLITVVQDRDVNTVEVRNTFPPSSFEAVENALETFSSEDLGVRSLSLTVPQMKEEAARAFDKAEQLYKNRDGRPENLWESIKRYRLVMDNLEPFVPKPKIWDLARKREKEATAALDKKIEDMLFNAEQAWRTEDFAAAKNEYAMVAKMLPPDDPRCQKARRFLLKINEILRTKKR